MARADIELTSIALAGHPRAGHPPRRDGLFRRGPKRRRPSTDMAELEGHDAFAALAGCLPAPRTARLGPRAHAAFERLRAALSEVPQRASPLDLAVSLRQALAFEHSAARLCRRADGPDRAAAFAGFQRWERWASKPTSRQAG